MAWLQKESGWQVQPERPAQMQEPEQQVRPEQRALQAWAHQVLRGGQAPAEAWWESCAELREEQDGQVQPEPAEPWRLHGELRAAQEHQEQQGAEAWEPWAQPEPQDAGARGLQVLRDGEPREEPGAEESEEEEEYS